MVYDVRTYQVGEGYPEPIASAAEAPAAKAPAAGAPAPEAKAEPTKPDAQQQPAAEQEKPAQPAAVERYELAAPADVPAKFHTDENLEALASFNAAAVGAGLPQQTAETLLSAYVDAQTVFDYGAPSQFSTGEEYTPDDAVRVLQGFWGDAYSTKIAEAQKNAKALGNGFLDWLDSSSMGNHPAVLVVLSNLGDTKLTKEQATAELQKLTGDAKSDYYSGDARKRQAAVLRAKVLGRTAYAE
jgi:hypothetical protein